MIHLRTKAVLSLTLIGFALRLHYATSTHPFFDEYATVLAARQILRYGWPILPSGLFYEHGLLATYLIAPFTALYINAPIEQWQLAHWGLMLSRWPSVLIGTATIPLIYGLGWKANRLITQNYQLPITNYRNSKFITHHSSLITHHSSLLAAGLFALSPEGMVWGGRARMYALATLLIVLTVYWAYRGALYPAPAKYRWLALLALLATLLTQFGAMMLVPALVAAMVVVGWISFQVSGVRFPVSRPWFLRPFILTEGVALVAVIGLAIFVKRLGRPIGFDSLAESSSGNIFAELFKTVSYQTALHFTWDNTLKFLSQQFGVPHHFWLTIVTIIGAIIGLVWWFHQKQKIISQSPISNLQFPNTQRALRYQLPITNYPPPNFFALFLWLTFGLIIIEMITLLEPFRRNPRYIVMYLPLFYLIAAGAIFNIWRLVQLTFTKVFNALRTTQHATRNAQHTTVAIIALILFTAIGFNDLRITLLTPEPAYEQAFAQIQAERQPGDIVLTMNAPAAALYLGQVDGFTVQNNADQFLLNKKIAPVDRWLGAPWLGTAADFNAAVNNSRRAWFVIDTIRQPVYFRGDWQAIVSTQLEPVMTHDNVLLYRTRPDRIPLPSQPDTLVNVTLNDSIELIGYTLNLQPPISNGQSQTLRRDSGQASTLYLTLFWQPLTSLPVDYTTFLHLRNSDGVTIAQRDSQPLDGAYPTSHWQPNEIVIDPITFALPPEIPTGTYTLFTGLYRLDTLERLQVANDTSGENAIQLGEVELP